MKKLIPLIAILFLVGCATGNICNKVPEGESVICDATDSIGVSPESLSNILVIVNVAALEKSIWTAREAMEFVEEAEKLLKEAKKWNNLITYGDVVDYLLRAYSGLSPRVQAVFVVIDPLTSLTSIEYQMPQFLSEFDIDMLLAHLDKQKYIISLYL